MQRNYKYIISHNIFNTNNIIRYLIILIPSIIASVVMHDKFYLLASLAAVASLISYPNKQQDISVVIKILTFIVITSWLINISYFYNYKIAIWIILILLAIIIRHIEIHNHDLKVMSSWIFIGSVYIGFELNKPILEATNNIIQIYVLSSITIIIFLTAMFKKNKIKHKKLYWKNKKNIHIINYIKYILLIIIDLIIWQIFNLKAPQWLLWSSLSVSKNSIDKSKQKIKSRYTGLIIGLGLGFIVAIIIPMPHNIYLISIFYAGIILSLRSFNSYVIGFTVRCFFVILLAVSDNKSGIGIYRAIDVFVGSGIGFLYSILYLKLLTKKFKKLEY